MDELDMVLHQNEDTLKFSFYPYCKRFVTRDLEDRIILEDMDDVLP
jgi:hypothetical protein